MAILQNCLIYFDFFLQLWYVCFIFYFNSSNSYVKYVDCNIYLLQAMYIYCIIVDTLANKIRPFTQRLRMARLHFGCGKTIRISSLRNTQLARLFFPTWDVRIYIPRNLPDNFTLSIPANVQTKLEFLGAKIYYVDMNEQPFHCK